VNSIKDYFHTDWSAMTQHDWLGLIMTIAVFLVMIGLYVYVFHPSNKERLEAHRHIPLDDDFQDDDRLIRNQSLRNQNPNKKKEAEDKK
jgi:cytochrome c oxidase cbb3-type subunit 4